jgi:aconitate hydratase 2/2-methylisocitrate dehydratase
MQGGYNIQPLIDLLDDATLAPLAAKGLSHTLLMFDSFHDVEEKAKRAMPTPSRCCNPGPMPSGS